MSMAAAKEKRTRDDVEKEEATIALECRRDFVR